MPSSHAPTEADGASSDEEQRSSKRSKSNTALSSTSDHQKGAPPKHVAQDVTALALNGGSSSSLVATPLCSAFGSFTPAKPPVAHLSWIGSSSDLRPPRDTPPSSARARQWKMSQIQRHADSMAFFSRDRLETRQEIPPSFQVDDCETAFRIDNYDSTGALLWVQTQCLEGGERPINDTWMSEGGTFSHTTIDSSGRRFGAERLLNSYGPWDDDDDVDDDDESESSLTAPQYPLAHSHLGITPYVHTPYNGSELWEALQYDFVAESTSLPRGLERLPFHSPSEINDGFLDVRGGWTVYDKRAYYSTISTSVQPLESGDACTQILDSWPKQEGRDRMRPERGTEMNLTVTISEEVGVGWTLAEMHLKPIEMCFPKIPEPPDGPFSVIAINEGTGYCWLGYDDGTVQYFATLDWMHNNFLVCPYFLSGVDNEEHHCFCTCGMNAIRPIDVISAEKGLGAVTNLVAVGHSEVVAAFSSGALRLIQKYLKGLHYLETTRQFIGHVNDGVEPVEMTVHSASRLMAIRGSDGQVRVWHLDDPYPLNSAWHRPRLPGRLATPLDLFPQSPAQQDETPSQRVQQQQESSATATTRGGQDNDDDAWDRLATQKVEEASFAELQGKRLSSLHASSFCSMTWTSTSWLADRDGQWEMSRQFNDEGRPKVVSAGLLPGLVVCSDRPAGTTFLYFEPERRLGVKDVEVEGGQRRGRATMVAYEGAGGLD